MLESTNIPEIQKACTVIRNMSEDAKLREISYQREKRLHDEASALGSARREGISLGLEKGRAEGKQAMQALIENLRAMGIPDDQIEKALKINKLGN